MSGTAPEPAVKRYIAHHVAAPSRAWPRLGRISWWPPLLLLLVTLIAITLAYSTRPQVTVDLGDYYDTAFLPNTGDRDSKITDFHAREVGTSGAEPSAYDWPATQAQLELPGGHDGILQATIEAAAGQPDEVLDDVALTVNDVRVSIARRTARELIAIVPADIAAAPQLGFQLVAPLNGDPDPPAGLAGRVLLAPARTYRWSSDSSTISLPGLGRGAWTLTLSASLHHPDNSPLNTTIYANGTAVATLPDDGPRRLTLLIPAALMTNGDLTLTINANTFDDPRPLGLLIYDVQVAPAKTAPWLPPLDSLLYAFAVALGVYICLLLLTRRAALSAVCAGLLILAGAWALASARYPSAMMLPRLAGLAIWSVLLLLALRALLAWAFRYAGVPLSDWALRALLLTFFVGYWIKASGMLYPYFVGIDVSWHMGKVLQILDGKLALFYGTNSPLNESTMPTAEWGNSRPVIPYSPWFHIFAVLFTYVPLPIVLVANMFSALVDCSRVLLIALLGRKSGLGERAALFAGLLYAVTPATFLLHSWGNIPTTFGMWWTLLFTVFIVAAYRRLDRPWPFAILTLLLLATLLVYTVMAAFMMLFLMLLVPALWIFGGRELPRRPLVALSLSAILALGLSMLIYYGQYIGPILNQTVPYFLRAAGADTSVGLQNREPFLSYVLNYWPRMDYLRPSGSYGLQLALMLGLLGIAALRSWRTRIVLVCWLLVGLAFLVVGSRISMVDKHVFYVIPALALGAGQLFSWFWRRGALGRVMVAGVYLFSFVAAIQLWVYRIAAVRQ